MDPLSLIKSLSALNKMQAGPAQAGLREFAHMTPHMADGAQTVKTLGSLLADTPIPQRLGDIPSFAQDIVSRGRSWYENAGKNEAALAALSAGYMGHKFLGHHEEKTSAQAQKLVSLFKQDEARLEKRAYDLAQRFLEKEASPTGAAIGAITGAVSAMHRGKDENTLQNGLAGAALGGLGGYHLGRVAQRVAHQGLAGDLLKHQGRLEGKVKGNRLLDYGGSLGLAALRAPLNPATAVMSGLSAGLFPAYRRMSTVNGQLLQKMRPALAQAEQKANAVGHVAAGGAGLVGGLAAAVGTGKKPQQPQEKLGFDFGAVGDAAHQGWGYVGQGLNALSDGAAAAHGALDDATGGHAMATTVAGTVALPVMGAMRSKPKADRVFNNYMKSRPLIAPGAGTKLALGAAGLGGAAYLLNRRSPKTQEP